MVLSGSMEPGFYRGDILFLNMGKAPIRTGEVVVFNLDGRDIPIVHRVIKVHERRNGTHIDVLTKVRSDWRVRFGMRPGNSRLGHQWRGYGSAERVCIIWMAGWRTRREARTCAYQRHRIFPCVHTVSCFGVCAQGDNNFGDDRALYNKGQDWLHQHHIMGRAVG